MKFKKEIVSSGVYLVQGTDGERRHEVITSDRLQHWADQHGRMMSAGMKVPAPWYHNLNSTPEKPPKVSENLSGVSPSSKDNAGYWDKLWVENGVLVGELECVNEEDGKKVGSSVKETSIYASPVYTDGDGKDWKDSLLHIALVTHPIESGQKNFEKIPEGGLALAMSQRIFTMNDGFMANPANLSEVLNKLSEIAKIVLPNDTTSDNFIDRLNAALSQKEASEQDNGDVGTVNTPPKNAVTQPGRVIFTMSTLNKEQLSALIDAGVVNPVTGSPFTTDDLAVEAKKDSVVMGSDDIPKEISDHPVVKKLANSVGVLMNIAENAKRDRYSDRVTSLVRSGVITSEYAEKHLIPSVSAFKMSLDIAEDGASKEGVDSIDEVLGALENLPAESNLTQSALQMSSSSGAVVHSPPFNKDELSPEDVDKAVALICSNTGLNFK